MIIAKCYKEAALDQGLRILVVPLIRKGNIKRSQPSPAPTLKYVHL
jgi:hypothetical protein